MSYFAKPKNEFDKPEQETVPMKEVYRAKTDDAVSTLGPGMLIKGNIVCEGPMQVFGRIVGEIHAVKLTIGHGAEVEGKITARATTIAGTFKGTINSESVRLESTAIVEGEIFKNALVIDQDAQFEGMTRKLEKSTDLPSADEILNAPAVVQVAAPQPVFVQPAAAAPVMQSDATHAPASNFVQRDAWTMPATNGHQ